MSSTLVTVKEFTDYLRQKYADDLLVAIPQPFVRPGEYHEGILDGPCFNAFKVIEVSDARTGFNPTELTNRSDFKVLVIQ